MLRISLILVAMLAVSGCKTVQPERFGYETPRKAERHCLTTTGSHIKRKSGECLPVPGRAYSRSDVLGSGAMSTAGALAGLDPSVRIGGN